MPPPPQPPIRPRRRRQSSLEKISPINTQSCDRLTGSLHASPEKSLQSFPERLSASAKDLKSRELDHSRRCRSCDGILEADEDVHAPVSLPAPLDAATQTKRKKNFMDRCVNKVRLC
ncbi:hypothetical protein EVAR_39058_1 [Eumeta japonica]|uniref:Uncharacterized protein n=1 Tax=Eumeta variegata TaxID=151549 RepID=A0A4C1WQZ1_EUMVA|nr:hypothetical protein EVAR_39058_1 [Eumeta japonica]